VFNAHRAVHRTALVGVTRNGATEPVLCVEPEKDVPMPREMLRQELLELGAARPHTQAIKTILFHNNFPVDVRHNAKIFREKLLPGLEDQFHAGDQATSIRAWSHCRRSCCH